MLLWCHPSVCKPWHSNSNKAHLHHVFSLNILCYRTQFSLILSQFSLNFYVWVNCIKPMLGHKDVWYKVVYIHFTCIFQETPHCHRCPWLRTRRWTWRSSGLPPEHTAERWRKVKGRDWVRRRVELIMVKVHCGKPKGKYRVQLEKYTRRVRVGQ